MAFDILFSSLSLLLVFIFYITLHFSPALSKTPNTLVFVFWFSTEIGSFLERLQPFFSLFGSASHSSFNVLQQESINDYSYCEFSCFSMVALVTLGQDRQKRFHAGWDSHSSQYYMHSIAFTYQEVSLIQSR